MNKGIAFAGNIIVDKIKMIDVYPAGGMLCNIKSQKTGVGGCVPNTAINLSKLSGGKIKIFAIGKTGNDASADYVLNRLTENNIDISGVIRQGDADTSFTDVMTETESGNRTFFHYRGANDEFAPEDIDFEKLNCDIIHIGYALLLEKFDQKNPQYGTELAKTLYNARQKGILTSIDVVSEQSQRFKEVVSCSLKYCDYVTLNEIESSNVSGIPLRDGGGNIIEDNLKAVCEWFISRGVSRQICIHFPEGCAALGKKGEYRQQPSLSLPNGYIKGTVGAGDAFCAGILYSAYNNLSLSDSLLTAVISAACNLSREDSISGMKEYSQAFAALKEYPLRKEIKLI
jgi:sugar/nucleoside kinase (ribokinase family)